MLESEEEVVAAHEAEMEWSEREAAVSATQNAVKEDSEEAKDPIELIGDDFDEPDDIPAVDMQ